MLGSNGLLVELLPSLLRAASENVTSVTKLAYFFCQREDEAPV